MSDSDAKSRQGRNALGRGLKHLIPDRGEGEGGRLYEVPVDEIERPAEQPRTHFDETGLKELTESIRESGVLQPLVVREGSDGFELIAGERRLRASKRAGLDEVPVVIRDVTDAEAYALALVENIQREDLNAIEEARAYNRLQDELGFTQAELANHLGKSRSTIANATRLLNLPASVQQMVVDGELSSGHARALVSLPDETAERLATRISKKGLSVREAEKLAQRAQKEEDDKKASGSAGGSRYRDDAQVQKITDDLQRALGTKVQLKDRHGEGKVEIHYDDYEILQSVLDRILREG